MITAEPDVTRLLTRMENFGLLVRRRGIEDRRVVTVTVTERGLRLLRVVEQPLRQLQAQQFALLSDDELNELIAGLEKVRESIAGED